MSIFALFTSFQTFSPRPRLCESLQQVKLLRRRIVGISPNHTSWRSTPCLLSETAYSVYSQLPSMSKGYLLHPHHDDVPCCGDTDPLLGGGGGGKYYNKCNHFVTLRSRPTREYNFIQTTVSQIPLQVHMQVKLPGLSFI